MQVNLVDFHVHTNASDGDYALEEVICRARIAGLESIAITDHDTTKNAVRSVLDKSISCLCNSLVVVPGVEFSCLEQANGKDINVHILGYFSRGAVSCMNALEPSFERIKYGRRIRLIRMVENLNAGGYSVSIADVLKYANGSGFLGTNHLLKALVGNGYFEDVDSADKELRGKYHIPYIREYSITASAAIGLIKQNSGLAVLAHPIKIQNKLDIEGFIARLKQAGLDGIESFCSRHDFDIAKYYVSLCSKYGLFCTAGSDYHGEVSSPKRKLGIVLKAEDARMFDKYVIPCGANGVFDSKIISHESEVFKNG